MAPMADRVEPSGVGARLKAAREARRVSLRQIANTTKIAVPAFEAIERNEVRKLPGGIFGRSFVRAYAREVGLDPDETARDFFAQFPELAEPVDEPPEQTRDFGAIGVLLESGAVRAAAVALPLVALAVWLVFGRGAGSPRDATPLSAERIAAVSTEVPAPTPLRQVSDVVPAGGALPAGDLETPLVGALTLHVTAHRECWVSITADGRERLSRLMGIGEQEAVRAASELRVKIGDASAVSLRLNGEPIRPLGRTGQVVTLRLDAANAAEWIESH